ncbi:hypothetical protein [Avibacterium paragallinarum]|uniref:Uncharacterized protein n=1 Tax=Avibacterium paragallinarum TaxID=728 RepID=A0ABU7QKG3_AVIPA|nr:hypothetical protein [Avibacterium paragallinarum]MEE3609380.1 hypothetical protein [Avibacterium paragallinarum]MEE3621509.1 hypothetical protein [Avibacterium paragallinarum]MEE3669351.1 hypothetical protein [Avibacterium paragallinarum]MEE3681655.1 hypothetical protein [Avibacterium paragallinarum]MEE4386657.1 hypothetical protein [Avibacterium paragallinarum]
MRSFILVSFFILAMYLATLADVVYWRLRTTNIGEIDNEKFNVLRKVAVGGEHSS